MLPKFCLHTYRAQMKLKEFPFISESNCNPPPPNNFLSVGSYLKRKITVPVVSMESLSLLLSTQTAARQFVASRTDWQRKIVFSSLHSLPITVRIKAKTFLTSISKKRNVHICIICRRWQTVTYWWSAPYRHFKFNLY